VASAHVRFADREEHVSGRCATPWIRSACTTRICFHGTRGVGKTTLARILAKCLNCERCHLQSLGRSRPAWKSTGPFRRPDGSRCATNTKVDENAPASWDSVYRAEPRRFKVYVIDEVPHALHVGVQRDAQDSRSRPSTSSSFLRHRPQKIPVTVLSAACNSTSSRCLRRDAAHLEAILAEEKLPGEGVR